MPIKRISSNWPAILVLIAFSALARGQQNEAPAPLPRQLPQRPVIPVQRPAVNRPVQQQPRPGVRQLPQQQPQRPNQQVGVRQQPQVGVRRPINRKWVNVAECNPVPGRLGPAYSVREAAPFRTSNSVAAGGARLPIVRTANSRACA